MKVTLLIDIGSTYTKIAAVDLDREELVGRSYAPSTASADMTIGIEEAYQKLLAQVGDTHIEVENRLACSSAAGGLRLVAIGLVPGLTSEAAKRAALGAGAKVTGVYSYRLTRSEVERIEDSAPDIILV
ncbi:MAG: glutamate mutase L, partial [Dehalococcoidia bacterium]|nr:glutamate mutase L [Dehalococcoidia bacterium]